MQTADCCSDRHEQHGGSVVFLQLWLVIYLLICVTANEQAEQRWSACELASLMPRKVLQQAEKFSIVLWKV